MSGSQVLKLPYLGQTNFHIASYGLLPSSCPPKEKIQSQSLQRKGGAFGGR